MILDIALPDADGLWLCEAAVRRGTVPAASGPDLRILMLTELLARIRLRHERRRQAGRAGCPSGCRPSGSSTFAL